MSVGVIVLLGPPGSGKGTQAKILAEKNPSWVHISTGDLFRREISSGSALGLSLKGILAVGQLVSDDTTNQVFQSQVRAILGQNTHLSALILDGYPRTGPQTETLFEFCKAESARLGSPVAVEIELGEEVLVERLSGRLINPRSGKIYHKVANPPKKPGICDEDGQPLIQRPDDQPEVIRSRYKTYAQQLQGILGALKQGGAPLVKVAGDASPQTVTGRLEKAIAEASASGTTK